jgi:DNA polymerase elongation subunit (family B)
MNQTQTKRARILYFDIETTDLNASFGEVISFGYQWDHENKPKNINMYDYKDWDKLPVEKRDLYLLEDVAEIMSQADIIVGHYSMRFDFPFLQTRSMMHGLAPLPRPLHVDTWMIARKQMKFGSNRLKNLSEAMNCDENKSSVPIFVWRRAKAHDLDAMKIISAYNLQDVRTQVDLSRKLFPLAKLPNRNVIEGTLLLKCSGCGGFSFTKRGYQHTNLYSYARLQCKDCGSWTRERNSCTDPKTQRTIR